ncbi:hypothetical protein GQ457_14G021200 [Hibiscus cannabinus]
MSRRTSSMNHTAYPHNYYHQSVTEDGIEGMLRDAFNMHNEHQSFREDDCDIGVNDFTEMGRSDIGVNDFTEMGRSGIGVNDFTELGRSGCDEEPNGEASNFYELLNEMNEQFYKGSKYSKLSLCIRLFHLKWLGVGLETTPATNHTGQINSNSVLVALLDSHYTELAELVEKALLIVRNRRINPFFVTESNSPATIRPVSARPKITPNAVNRPDGVIHGIEQLLIPRSVQQDFNNRRSLRSISAIKPEGAPEVDPRTHRLKKPAPPVLPGAPPVLPIYDAMAPGPSLAPAPAPGPGGPHHHFNGMRQVKDFIETLLQYGGYNEMADILVNLTSLATEMGRLVSEGYVLTVLAPNDEAMAKLTTDQLSEPGAPEQIIYYHIIPEYQTEESMYNAVRRFGKVSYDTLRLPHKVLAQEADGSVRFGHTDGSAYLFDPDIYTDGRISVQGIDNVLFPPEDKAKDEKKTIKVATVKSRRGKLLDVACQMLGAIGQDSRFMPCQL